MKFLPSFLQKLWHKKFHKKKGTYTDLKYIDGYFVQYKKCSKCNITITFKVGRVGEDE